MAKKPQVRLRGAGRLGPKSGHKVAIFQYFSRDKVYMLFTHKRNIVCVYDVKWSRNVDLKAKKPLILDKTNVFSVPDFSDSTKFQKPKAFLPFIIFWCGFLHHVENRGGPLFLRQIFELGPRSPSRHRGT